MSTPLDTKEFMAEMSAQMQQERWLQAAKQYLPIILASAVLIILTGFGVSYWQHRTTQTAEAQTAQLLRWSEAPHTPATADEIMKISANWRGPRTVLAKLLAAEHWRAAGQPAKADEILTQLAKNAEASELNDFAALNSPAAAQDNLKLHSKAMQQAAAELQGWQHYNSATTPALQNQAKTALQQLAQPANQPKDLSPAAQQRLSRLAD